MNQKLFPNIKKLTTIFSIAILILTVVILLLKLTVFSSVDNKADKASNTAEQVKGESDYEFEYEISDRIIFTTASSPSNPRIKNSESNTALMQVDIKENNRSIYISGNIHPGISKSTIKLQHTNLKKGVYECTAYITALDPVTLEVIATYEEPIIIEIQNDSFV